MTIIVISFGVWFVVQMIRMLLPFETTAGQKLVATLVVSGAVARLWGADPQEWAQRALVAAGVASAGVHQMTRLVNLLGDFLKVKVMTGARRR